MNQTDPTAALREAIAKATFRALHPSRSWDRESDGVRAQHLEAADAVLAELPQPTGQGAVPPAALESAANGATMIDAWAEDPHGRNFLAHALVQLARDGWLRTEPGEGFEPVRDNDAVPEPQDPAELRRLAVEAHHTGTQQPSVPASRLSGQHADALWDAIAPPGPARPSYPVQHERVCRVVADIVDEVTAGAGARPARGDQVETWLKTQRDLWDRDSALWTVLDTALDNYRLHADTGTPLGEHVCEGRMVGDCECLEPAPVAQQPAAADSEETTVGDAQQMLTRMRADAATHSLDDLLRLIAQWADDCKEFTGMDEEELVRRLEEAGYHLPATP
jgi:hypothetical protein